MASSLWSGSKVGYVVSAQRPFSGAMDAAYAVSNSQRLSSQRRTGPYVRYQQISAPKSPAFAIGREINLGGGPSQAAVRRGIRVYQGGSFPNIATF